MNKTKIKEKATKILHQLYGKDAKFHPGQYEAIEAALTNRRTLVVQKTGWGKSLVYFIAAKMVKGMTIVISPLLVLMDNQKEYAQKLGLRCETLNSSVKDGKNYMARTEMLERINNGECNLLFTTPETLYSPDVQNNLPNWEIGLFVVDECHCISDWGHDFRLEYSRLNRVIRMLPESVPVLGTTATANDRVIEDLKGQFGGNVFVSRGPLTRESLHIQVLKMNTKAERYAWIKKNINKLPGSGIIYCLTQRDCQNLADFLKDEGISARAYYSGNELEKMGDDGLTINQETEKLFATNKIKVIVATIKLGMGYDKRDIGFVIHFQRPSSLVAYYQQIGRAGRKENMDAYCYLMTGEEDRTIQEYFINNAFPVEEEERKVIDAIEQKGTAGAGKTGLMHCCNMNNKALERSIMFLTNQGYIYYENKKYYRSAKQYRFMGAEYDAVKEQKRAELEMLDRFTDTMECYSEFVAKVLNDETAYACGKCSNCTGTEILNGIETPTDTEIARIQERLNRLYISISPRQRWPEVDPRFDAKTTIAVPNEIGVALCKYGDAGYGKMVKYDKYHADAFRDELVEKSAEVLQERISGAGYTTITNIPSERNTKVADFARRLAERMGYEYAELLEVSGEGEQQKTMQNSSYQCANAKRKLCLKGGVIIPERVILVDDMVDSKWTLTVAGRLLTMNGSEKVFPFCLADSSQMGGEG